jgi:hypothetical protein
MCGSVGGCGSGGSARFLSAPTQPTPTPKLSVNVDDIIDDMINDHKKAIAKLTKIRSLVKSSRTDDIKKAIKEFADKL